MRLNHVYARVSVIDIPQYSILQRTVSCHVHTRRHSIAQDSENNALPCVRYAMLCVQYVMLNQWQQIGPVFGTDADRHPEYGTSIGCALSTNQTLKGLNLSSNGLSAACGQNMTSALKTNRYTAASVYVPVHINTAFPFM